MRRAAAGLVVLLVNVLVALVVLLMLLELRLRPDRL